MKGMMPAVRPQDLVAAELRLNDAAFQFIPYLLRQRVYFRPRRHQRDSQCLLSTMSESSMPSSYCPDVPRPD